MCMPLPSNHCVVWCEKFPCLNLWIMAWDLTSTCNCCCSLLRRRFRFLLCLQEGKTKPWPVRGEIKPYTGNTKYVLNDDGLIYKHLESWDVRPRCHSLMH